MKTYDPLNAPDRDLDPPDYGDVIECRGCGKDIPESEHRGFRCGPCWMSHVQRERSKELSEVMTDITRSLDKLGQLPMFKRQAE